MKTSCTVKTIDKNPEKFGKCRNASHFVELLS
jgi:hypothetical protein